MKSRQLIFIFLFLCLNAYSKIKLSPLFSENMVLQQNTEVKLWGEALVGAKLTVKTTWNNCEYKTIVGKDGKWNLKVKTSKAGGPYKIIISDGEPLILNNILLGEVWFCSGQSNMEMPLRGFDRQPLNGGNDVIAKSKPTTPIRFFVTDSKDGKWIRQYNKKPQIICQGEWIVNSSEYVGNVSAVSYFFAEYIQDVLEVPVGIIISTLGGSKIEPWMSREAFQSFNDVDLSFLDSDENLKDISSSPCVLYNAKIAPFIDFPIRGFLWYQGESNRDNANIYSKLMSAFVKDLRLKWNIDDLPFYFVEIAPFNYEGADKTSAARLREAQLQSMKEIPNSGLVSLSDIDNPVFIHPVDKYTVGKRLAWWALAKTYGKRGFGCASPIYTSSEVVENKIYINVLNAENGLCPMWTSLKGFEIAGEDRVFYEAFAEIETKSCRLAVSSPKVPHPVAVRYCYKNYSVSTVYNTYGLPLFPFRTDKWN